MQLLYFNIYNRKKEGVEGVVTAKPLPPGSALLKKGTLVPPLRTTALIVAVYIPGHDV